MSEQVMIQVLSEILNSTSSGTGNSFYNQACPRRAKLDKEFPELRPAFELQVGLIFHKLQELWRTDLLRAIALPEQEEVNNDDPIAEAQRLFRAYVSYYGDEQGKPKDFITAAVEAPVLDEGEFGVPFTMRTDAVVEATDLGCKLRGLKLEPGFYLLDYKTTGAKQSDQCIKDDLNTQFKAYIHIWNKNKPECQVKGLIVDRIIRYKRDMMKPDPVTGLPKGLESTLIKAPTEKEVEAIKRYYQWKKEFLQTDYCNLDACSYPRICRHYTQGTCDRISC